MNSFQAKICWKMMRWRENKNYCSVPFLPDEKQKILKNSNKFKKLKNTITDSFEAKLVRKRLRKTENKKYRSVSFLPCTKQKIQRKQ